MARAARLERAPSRPSRCSACRRIRAGAAARQLDANLHGQRGGLLAQFFPLFLLGALFGKLMDDSGCVSAIAGFMTERLGERRAVLAVVLAGALVTYGGVSRSLLSLCSSPWRRRCFEPRPFRAA